GNSNGSPGNGVYYSINAGATWTRDTNVDSAASVTNGNTYGRITLALHDDANNNYKFVVSIAQPILTSPTQVNPVRGQLYKMLERFSPLGEFNDLTPVTPNYLSTQGNYDTTLAISPTNAD